jgi:transcriptional regulator with GAF, ATPase, and Fis domain
LFLDEIGELDLQTQVKLLRLLEEREFTRVGSTRARQLQARIITATNRDLAKMVEEGRFRADLRYRLEVFVVEVPPLRARGDDVFLLTGHYVAQRARALGRREPRLHPDVVKMLRRYPFPGNIRELRNMVDQAVLLAKSDEITLEEMPVLSRLAEPGTAAPAALARPPVMLVPPLPAPAASSDGPGPSPRPPASIDGIRAAHAEKERRTLHEALEAHGGNVTRAAKAVGMSRFQLMRRLSKYGMR